MSIFIAIFMLGRLFTDTTEFWVSKLYALNLLCTKLKIRTTNTRTFSARKRKDLN